MHGPKGSMAVRLDAADDMHLTEGGVHPDDARRSACQNKLSMRKQAIRCCAGVCSAWCDRIVKVFKEYIPLHGRDLGVIDVVNGKLTTRCFGIAMSMVTLGSHGFCTRWMICGACRRVRFIGPDQMPPFPDDLVEYVPWNAPCFGSPDAVPAN